MITKMAKVRPLLAEKRIFLTGVGVDAIEKTGASYRDDATVRVQQGIELEPYTTFWRTSGLSLISMGAFSYTHSLLPHLVSVGRYTSIAAGVTVLGDSHPMDWASTSPVFYNKQLMLKTYEADSGASGTQRAYGYKPERITIGNDVWIGEGVSLAHGITIGDGAVIASKAIITKDVEPYTFVAGVPGVKKRDRFDPETVHALMKSEWWRFSPDSISDIDVRNPLSFATGVTSRFKLGDIRPYVPGALIYSDFKALS